MKTSHLGFLADEICLAAVLGVAFVASTEQQALLIYKHLDFHCCVKIIQFNDLL